MRLQYWQRIAMILCQKATKSSAVCTDVKDGTRLLNDMLQGHGA